MEAKDYRLTVKTCATCGSTFKVLKVHEVMYCCIPCREFASMGLEDKLIPVSYKSPWKKAIMPEKLGVAKRRKK
jgi:hypothetical protein